VRTSLRDQRTGATGDGGGDDDGGGGSEQTRGQRRRDQTGNVVSDGPADSQLFFAPGDPWSTQATALGPGCPAPAPMPALAPPPGLIRKSMRLSMYSRGISPRATTTRNSETGRQTCVSDGEKQAGGRAS
jgi:hypothetical protein